MFELRPYQQRATDAAKEFLRQSIDPALIDAAPAAGKSYMVAEMAKWFREISGGKRVLCLQPNSKLVKQNVEKFMLTGEACSIFSASAGSKSTRHGVIFATPGTVKNAISRFKRDYCAVIVDEAHGLTPTILAIIDAMREANPNLRILGLTGTPYKMNTGYIFRMWPDDSVNDDDTCRDPYFVKMVYRVPASEMLDDGFITPMQQCCINDDSLYDVSDIKLLPNGTLDHATVEHAFEGHGRRTAGVVRDVMAQTHAKGVKGGVMLFAATQRHAMEILASLPPGNSAVSTGDHGILMGRDATDDQIVKAYRNQEFKYLVSVSKYCIGFDVDHTEFIALLRYSESPDLTVQILGRAWRLHPDKPLSYVADYCGNLDRHFPDGDIYNPEIKARKASSGTPIEAECPDCNHVNEFTLQADYADFQRDKNGYALDVFGERIQTDFGHLSVHYGRRCFGMLRTGAQGQYERCNYRWSGKDCENCGEVNDIAARFCYVCKAEIVNPNDRIIADFKARKKDPTQPQTDRIVSLSTIPSVSQRGNETLRIDFVTEYRQFSIWLMPASANGRAAADWAKWEAVGGEPKTVSYVKEPESNFFRVLAYDRPSDDEDLPQAVMDETSKMRRFAA